MIKRINKISSLEKALGRFPVTALLGPRRCGKTTLAKMLYLKDDRSNFFDLESQIDRTRLQNPELVLGGLSELVIIDEIQTMPELFPILRVLADRDECNARFLILGSASPALIKDASESLAGRIEFVDLHGFDLEEVGGANLEQLWLRGGFPDSFLAKNEEDSFAWREGFIRTFLERDLPQLGISIPEPAMRRFWTMLSHLHGQLWNASELSRSMGLTGKTVKSYLDILTQTYMIRQLQPWFENIGKRQVKAPKVYFRDSGLLHSLLVTQDHLALSGHPKVGASWEGFALEQVLRLVQPPEAYFWATHNGAELDLMFMHNGKRYGIEFKYSESPKVTKSMRIAIDSLSLSHLIILSRCPESFKIESNISASNLKSFKTDWQAVSSPTWDIV